MALTVAISASFFNHTMDFSLKIKIKIFGIFSHKPVLGSPDNTLTKF